MSRRLAFAMRRAESVEAAVEILLENVEHHPEVVAIVPDRPNQTSLAVRPAPFED